MNKFWIVLSHSFMTRFKSKSFIITTAIFLLFIVGIGNVDRIIGLFDSDDVDQVAVIDETGELYHSLVEQNELLEVNYELVDYDGTLEDAEEEVLSGVFNGVLHIESDPDLYFSAVYYTDQLINQSIQYQLMGNLQQIKDARAMIDQGIDQAVLEAIYQPISFETIALELSDGTTARTEEEIGVARGLVYMMIIILYMAVLMYGNMIAMDIANEKSSRVMEILISSSSPISQMFAKIIGISLLGLTQIGLFLVVGYFMIQSRAEDMVGEFFEFFGFSDVPVSTYIYAIIFFLLGYFLYATLSAMLGSLVTRMEDVSQILMPMTLLIFIAYFIAIFGINMPESSLVTITSFIPFFAPFVMFLRVGLLEVPTWEIALSIGLSIGTIILLALIGARVYRGGVLMYGRSASLKDFKRALQLSKKDK
ncbi:MAG TPA: ABC transporter permease [Bacilli bacterium]|nr:ABC transporter permease [Bacilli bacterium]